MTEKNLEDYFAMDEKTLMVTTAYKVDEIINEKLPEISDHLARQNGQLDDHALELLERKYEAKFIAKEQERAYERERDRQKRSWSKRQKAGISGGVVVGIATLIAILIQSGQIAGWW